VRRVLTPDGTLWLNLGDTYSAGGRGGGGKFMHLRRDKSWRGKTGAKGARRPPPGLMEKQLLGIPWHVAFALQADGWWLRSEIIWEKPNAAPSSVSDRPTCAHEHVFLFAKNPDYFFDQDAVREPYSTPERAGRPIPTSSLRGQRAQRTGGRNTGHDYDKGGRNIRTVWRIATDRSGSETEHTARMPRALARRCILAGSEIGDDVIDPFGGSGTVGVVAEEEGRNATLIDLDERACEQAERRCAQLGLYGKSRQAPCPILDR
jgi:DNA modification methylase